MGTSTALERRSHVLLGALALTVVASQVGLGCKGSSPICLLYTSDAADE